MRHFFTFIMLVILLFNFAACSDDTGGITGGTGGTGTVMDDNPTVTNPDYVAFFDPAKIHDITITISQQEWTAMSNDLYKSQYQDDLGRNDKDGGQKYLFNAEIYRLANYSGGGATFNNIGFRVRGNTSRYFPQIGNNFYWAHFKISFSQDFGENEDVYGSPGISFIDKAVKRCHGVRGLILKYHSDDPSGVKEPLSYDLLRRFGLLVPGYTFARLTFNVAGTPRYFGLYQVYEPVDKEFIRLRWGNSAWLFKCLYSPYGPAALNPSPGGMWSYNKNVTIGIEQRDPATAAAYATWKNNPWDGGQPVAIYNDRPYRPPYDLKAKEDDVVAARDGLDSFIQGISSKNGSTFNGWITSVFDVDGFLRHQAVTGLLGQWDDYWNNFNNYYLLKRPSDGRWVLIPYDYDHTFEMEYKGTLIYNKSLITWGRSESLLATKILDNPVWMNKYKDYIRILISPTNSYFTAAAIGARIDALQDTIGSPGAPIHNNPVESAYSPAAGKTTLLDFVNARVTFAQGEVGGGGGYAKVFNSLYVRGSSVGGWNSTDSKQMTLVADNTWRVTVSGVVTGEYKFDEANDFISSWGDLDGNGIADQESGNNITCNLTGSVIFTFNDSTKAYSISN